MAGTGLPTGDNRPALTEPRPLVQTDGSAAQMWGAVKDAAGSGVSLGLKIADVEREGYRADLETKVHRDVLDIYAQHPDDPKALDGALRAYSDGVLDGVSFGHADIARHVLQKAAVAAQSKATTVWIAKTAQQNTDRIDTRMQGLLSEGMGYAGAGNGDGMTQAFTEFSRYADEKARTGLWSQEHANAAKDHFQSQGKAEAGLSSVAGMFRMEGPNAALAHADSIYRDPALPLGPAERERFIGRAHALVNDLSSRKARDDATEASANATTYAQRLADLQKRAIDGTATESDLLTAYHAGQLEPNDYISLYRSVHKQAEESAATLAAIQRVDGAGRPQGLADRIIGAESGGRADATNPNSSAVGAGQFIKSTWLDLVKRNAPDAAAGKSDAEILALRADPKLSRQMVDAYITDNRAKLAAQNLPTDDGAAYLAHFAGPGGAAAVLKADPSTPVRAILSADAMQANAGMRRSGKPFADWTAADLTAWAADKVTTGPAATYFLDPRSSDDRNAANLHWQALSKQMDASGFTATDRQDVTLSTITRTGVIPDAVAGDIRAKLRNGPTADRLEVARFIDRLNARAPWVAKDLDGEDFTLAHIINDNLKGGADSVAAVQRADDAMRQDPAELERRKQAYGAKKTQDANRSWLTKQGRHWFSANAAVPDALAGDFEESVKDAFLATGNLDVARKVAWKDLSNVWAETSIGGKRFERYAPEAIYANGRDPAWIEGQLFHDLAQAGTAAPVEKLSGKVRLQADPWSRHERQPSYIVLEQNELGQWLPIRGADGAPKLGPDGKPMRWRPDWNTSPAADEERRGMARTMDRARVSRDMRDLKPEIPANSTAGLFLPR